MAYIMKGRPPWLGCVVFAQLSTHISKFLLTSFGVNLGPSKMQRGNFQSTSSSIGVRAQLTTLSTIMKSVDPKLHEHLGTVIWSWNKGASMYGLIKYVLCRKS